MNFYQNLKTPARVLLIAATVAATLAGCASSTDLSQSKPDFFKAKISDGTLSGQYNPAGFKSAEVRDLLAANCNGGKLGGYGEQPADGLVAFTATCQNGTTAHGGSMEFERIDGKVTSQGTVYDKNGNLSASASPAA